METCEALANRKCFAPLRTLVYVVSYFFAGLMTFFDLGKDHRMDVILMAVTIVLVIIVTALELVLVFATRNVPPDDPHHMNWFVRMWYLLKPVVLAALFFSAVFGVDQSLMPQVVLVVLSFEGAWYLLSHYESPRSALTRLRISLYGAASIGIIILVVTCVFSLLGWILFRDITPAVLQADGVMGPDTLFTNIWFSFLTLWQIAEADNLGQLARALERLKPGASIFFVVYNLFVYYLLTSLLIAMYTASYQDLSDRHTLTTTRATVMATTDKPNANAKAEQLYALLARTNRAQLKSVLAHLIKNAPPPLIDSTFDVITAVKWTTIPASGRAGRKKQKQKPIKNKQQVVVTITDPNVEDGTV